MALNKKYESMRQGIRTQSTAKKTGGGTKFNLPEGVNFFTPKVGTNKIRIVPYDVTISKHPNKIAIGNAWHDRQFAIHYNVGAEDKSYICPKTVGQRCPICEYRLKLAKSQNPDEAVLKALKPKDRVLYNVINMDDLDAGLMLWEISFHNFTKKLNEEISEGDDDYDYFAIPDESGKVLVVRFAEKTLLKNTFLEASRIDFKNPEEAIADDILEAALDLDAILKVLPYNELEAIFLEIPSEETAENTQQPEAEPQKEERKRTPRTPKKEEQSSEDTSAVDEEAKKAAEEAAEKARKDAIRLAKAKKAEEATNTNENECPAGGVFGKDTDNLPACDTCKKWDACITQKEG
jgi:hypothetical protein